MRRTWWTAPLVAGMAAFGASAEAEPAADGVALPATPMKPPPQFARAVQERLPLAFEVNRGQAPQGWDFLVRCRGYHAFVRSTGVVFSFDGAGLAMSLAGAAPVPPTTDGLALSGKANYFLGDDASKWLSDVPLVRGARYPDVAPRTAWGFAGDGRRLEFSFDLAPGADDPRLRFDGARGVNVAHDGSLRIAMPDGVATVSAPLAWQDADGRRVDARARFVVERDGRVRVAVSPRDPNRAVHVDPTMTYETYLGGSNTDQCTAAAMDASYYAYLAGSTMSADFPATSGSYSQVYNTNTTGQGGSNDVVVTKVSPDGQTLAYSTFIGGLHDDLAYALAVDSSGNAFVVGATYSSNYPTTAGVFSQTQLGQGFITELNPSGSSLVFSTYTKYHVYLGIGFGPNGGVYVNEGQGLSLYSAGGTSLVFFKQLVPSITIGGQSMSIYNLCSDSNGAAYVVGTCSMQNYYATSGAYQTTIAGQTDAFVTKIDSAGNIVFNTFIGGTGGEIGYSVDVNLAGQAYVAGSTYSSNFPVTPDAFRSSQSNSNGDAFVARLNASGSALRYSTYLGGGVAQTVRAHGGSSFVVGGTPSTGFQTLNAFQSTAGDGFLAKFNRDDTPAWVSYCGGTTSGNIVAAALGPNGTIAAGGQTSSTNVPTVNPIQSSNHGAGDDLVLVVPDTLPAVTKLAITTTTCPTWTVGYPYDTFFIQTTGGVGPLVWSTTAGTVPPGASVSAAGTITGTFTQTGSYTFTVHALDPSDMTADQQLTLQVNPTPTIPAQAMPAATLGAAYDRPAPVAGGSGAMTYSLVSGSPPQGMSLLANGHVKGTPQQAGDATFTVQVVDGRGATGSGPVTVHVNPPPIVTTATLPDWTETRPYSAQLAEVGGTPSIAWSVAGGTAPAPSLDAATGRLSGVARAAGTYAFTVHATDVNGAFGTRDFAVTINALPAVTTTTLPPMADGRPYSATIQRTGGTAPFAWSVSAGALPTGLSVGDDGKLTGTPTSSGAFDATLQCVDAAGASVEWGVSFTSAAQVDLTKKKASESVAFTTTSATSVERYVELTRGALLGVQVKGGGANGKGPTISLADATGAPIDLSAWTKATTKSATVKGFPAPATGRYFLVIAPAVGFQGTLKDTVTVAPAASFSSSASVGPGTNSDFLFSAPPGALVAVFASSVKPGVALPHVVSLVGPDGTDLVPGGKLVEKGKTASFSSKTALVGGDYHVVFGARDANAGDIQWTVKLKLPKTDTFALPDLAAGE